MTLDKICRHHRLLIGSTMAVLLCGGTISSATGSNENRKGETVQGTATVYSDSLAGKKTTTGQPYRKQEMTAASPTLPLGSKVAVTNKNSGRSAVVKINDRERHGGVRAVDLSKAAANKLGVKGKAPVEAKVLSPGQR
jgi:rare lipoprotein A